MQEVEIKKIAEELNISQTTVSRALSGNGRVSQNTKDKIGEYLRDNNYSVKSKNVESTPLEKATATDPSFLK